MIEIACECGGGAILNLVSDNLNGENRSVCDADAF